MQAHDMPDLHLKPMHLVDATSVHSTSGSNVSYYNPLESDELRSLATRDLNLKSRIRILKIVNRLSATILSAVTLGLLLATIVKFLLTKDVYFEVNGVKRTAWAKDTITWYTYMYASIAGISFIINAIIMLSYCRSIRAANRAATVSTWWTWIIFSTHVVIWAVSAGIYRYGKEPVDGKFRDLWGWTCSSMAKELQQALTSVDFEKYCTVQSSGWYTGLANAAVGLLGGVITGLEIYRARRKKKIGRMSSRVGGTDLEPLRHHQQHS